MRLKLLIFVIFLQAQVAWADNLLVLQLKWKPQFQFAGYYVAQELGYYKEAGLSVEIHPGGPGRNSLTEVLEGRADFGVSSSNLVAERIKGAPVKALAAIFQNSPARFITLKSSGIERAEQLRGKRVMLLPNNASFELVALLNQLNLLEQVERIDTSFNIDSLVDGETDAFNGYATNEPFALQEWGVEYNLIDPADSGIRFYADVLFTSDQLARERPADVRAFTKASLRGWKYALQYPSEAIEIVSRFAPEKSLSHLRYEALSMHSHMSKDLVPIGYMNTERWMSIKAYLASIGEIPADSVLDIDQFIFPIEPAEFDWKQHGWIVITAVLLPLLLLAWAIWAHRQKEIAEEKLESTFNLATHDPLTGLANRYLFIDRFRQVLAHKEREALTPLLAFIDIDKFKAVNDTRGHHEGDALLKALAAAMLDETRPSDTLARIGGDEFALLVDNTHSESEEVICQRLHEAVERVVESFELQELQVNASIGVLILDANLPDEPEALLALADREMYAAKCSQSEKVRIARLSQMRGFLYEVSG